MKIGIIGPSKLDKLESVNPDYIGVIKELAKKIARSGNEIFITADKGSSSEMFAEEYERQSGKNVFSIVPLDDVEFGFDWVNADIGEKINCGTWRNQPEKLNEETEVLVCIGYAVGVLAEIAYTKWFKPKPVYIIKELVTGELPSEINMGLDLRYVSVGDFEQELKRLA